MVIPIYESSCLDDLSSMVIATTASAGKLFTAAFRAALLGVAASTIFSLSHRLSGKAYLERKT